jgi:hypothetical protein
MPKPIIRTTFSLILTVLLISLAACNRPDDSVRLESTPKRAGLERTLRFQGAIRQGPNAALAFIGDLHLAIAESSSFQGTLTREDRTVITTTGQVDGQAIHLVFDLGNDAFVFGVGTLQNRISASQGVAGGLLTGPQPGDSGDWVGRWTAPAPATLAPKETSDTSWSISPFIDQAVLIVLVLTVVCGVLAISRWARRPPPSPADRSTIPSVSASSQIVPPEVWPGETDKPFVQFATTYALGDDRYDMTFNIEQARDYLGECGAGITETLGRGKPRQVTALEVWLFDKNDTRTATTVLISERGFGDPELRARLEQKGEVVLIQPDRDIELKTRALRVRARVIEIEYSDGETHPRGIFSKVSLKLGVWRAGMRD